MAAEQQSGFAAIFSNYARRLNEGRKYGTRILDQNGEWKDTGVDLAMQEIIAMLMSSGDIPMGGPVTIVSPMSGNNPLVRFIQADGSFPALQFSGGGFSYSIGPSGTSLTFPDGNNRSTNLTFNQNGISLNGNVVLPSRPSSSKDDNGISVEMLDFVQAFKLLGSLTTGGTASANWMNYTLGGTPYETSYKFTMRADVVPVSAVTGDIVIAARHKASNTWHVIFSNSGVTGIGVGKTDSTHAKGASGTISVYTGTLGSETDSGVNISAYNRFADLDSGKWVAFAQRGGGYELIAGECG